MELIKAYVGITLAGLFFVLILAALLVIVDHKARIRPEEARDWWSIQGHRKDHPIWAWFVSVILWVIVGSIIFGIIYRKGFDHHGPQYAKKLAQLVVKTEEEKEKSPLFKEVKKETIFSRKAHFHNLIKDPTEEGKQPVCYYCHGNYPHKRQPMIRTLLNMHTQFIGCMTCHVEGIPEEEFRLAWYNYSGIKPKGRPFGLAYDPATGALEKTDDYYSKIVVFVKDKDGKERPLEIPEDDPKAREFIKIRGELTPEEQGKIKNMFHKNVRPKGRFCTRCHRTKDSYIPFEELGFSKERILDLTGLNIVGIVQKYKEFYIPTIFRDTKEPANVEEILGKEERPVEIPVEMLRDPRFWWKGKYMAPPAER